MKTGNTSLLVRAIYLAPFLLVGIGIALLNVRTFIGLAMVVVGGMLWHDTGDGPRGGASA